MAMVSCVSREMAPRDMPPVQKRRMMAAAGSTSDSGTAGRLLDSSRQSRSVVVGASAKCCM